MGRKLTPRVSAEDETSDRRAFLRWLGNRRLQDAGDLVGRNKGFMSMWVRHLAELQDAEIDQWVEATGISQRTFLEGRFESRKRFSERGGAAA